MIDLNSPIILDFLEPLLVYPREMIRNYNPFIGVLAACLYFGLIFSVAIQTVRILFFGVRFLCRRAVKHQQRSHK